MILKKFGPQGLVCPPSRGNIHVYYNNIQRFSSLKSLGIKAKFYRKNLWEVGTNMFINNPGHMTKMADMPIQDKNPSKLFSRTAEPIATKLYMLQLGLEYYIIFINHDLVMTLTNFKARST